MRTYLSQISEKTIVRAMLVGVVIVGAMIVGAMIVGAMRVSHLIINRSRPRPWPSEKKEQTNREKIVFKF